jgi:glycosyltransferase involved in cell wall biosynthesis
MKIANIVCVYYPYKSGIGNAAYNFAKYGNELDFENTIFTPRYTNDLRIIDNYENIKVIRLRPWLKYGNAAFIPGLFFYLKKYDIIYLHYPFFGGAEIVWLFKLIFGKKTKLIIHYHMDVSGLSILAKILSLPSIIIRDQLFKMADLISCASLDYVKTSQIKKIYELNHDKFYEIPFGVDEKVFYPAENLNEISNNKIVFIGGLDKAHYFKGIDVLLTAFKDIKIDNKVLIIIGKGDLKNNYQILAKKLNIEKNVIFCSDMSHGQIAGILRTSSVLVLPSINKNEAFGMVLLEAMASGIPVVASNLPGVRSVFTNNLHGLLVNPNDANDLKIKIEEILTDNKKRISMGKESRKIINEKYTWHIFKSNLLNIYNVVLGK